jgi:hypothetical protein
MKKLKVSLKISSAYGFDKNWNLEVNEKSFFLGQDVKFLNRVLQMSPKNFIELLGTNDLSKDKNLEKAGKLIYKKLGINSKNYQNFDNWSFSAV